VQVDEITIPSPDFPGGQTFGPVTLTTDLDVAVGQRLEVPVTFAPRRRRIFGIDWYPHLCHVRGAITVAGDQITLVLMDAQMQIQPAAWWRRLGYWLLARPEPSSTGTAYLRSRLQRR
jgi:hypothetical protein